MEQWSNDSITTQMVTGSNCTIVGKGLHSVNSQPVIKPALINLLDSNYNKINVKIPVYNTGMLVLSKKSSKNIVTVENGY